ncbi:MAG: electron transport complex subunit RsxC [Proteobacteria bacterium]|nr:electron transport complex subunit RsxC [Pseudomonadota bacterium]
MNLIKHIHHLWSFPGGLKLDDNKQCSNQTAISSAKLPRYLSIPLSQHIGQAAEPIVALGDKVLKGQLLAIAKKETISANIHASSSGIIYAIEERLISHPSGLKAPCIIIETDGYDQWVEHSPTDNIQSLSPQKIIEQVADAGVVGLGGALFPAAPKLNTAQHHNVETLIINAAECEPYITCDDILMQKRPEEVILGILLMKKAVGAKNCLIGIEDNKPEAYQALLGAIKGYKVPHSETKIELIQVPTRYPAGGEKQLIQILTGQEVPSRKLPMDIGIVCHNITTAAAIYQAVYRAEPLISRIVTITGGAIKRPQNIEVLIGTPIREVLQYAGLDKEKADKVILGGPMMGFEIPSIDSPISKAANCILVSNKDELATPPPAMPCIRCARCADSCPMSLLPQQIYWYAKARDLDKAQEYHLFDCIECGCCSYVCPSNIPLVQYYRYAKTEILAEQYERNKADIARERHEFRQQRLEKAKLAKAEASRLRKEKLAKKKAEKEAAQADGEDATDDQKKSKNADLIKEAIARSQAKKALQKEKMLSDKDTHSKE